MFTGIVQTRLPVAGLERKEDFATFTFEFPEKLSAGLQIGASVAINGTCLTVRTLEQGRVSFDAIGQTLKVTNLGDLQPGSIVNIERAARFGDEIGGHVLSGHIMDQVAVLAVEDSANNRVVWMERPAHLSPYLLDKGYVALNGCSLTIAEVTDDRFCVHLIPETRDVTTFGMVQVGDRINVEVDAQTQAVVETVRRLLADPQMSALLSR
ncbi:riboflavin synthase subunit alpha [Thalassolituus hydrocarboniclasticus]|uniref:Riboflavin synthase n=1 Tax=Thalassolituus hydrocarboniclasticus TaxID=2742796 RepID=A0ABY6A912_9GAMM|nr:riboflavin synthase subunit alpha [Thalassolituus hydrocarboniclasticus]UXD87147.1 riboflavin synthase subunit alpha [Thalassolituus hydrocarboniclasticus]